MTDQPKSPPAHYLSETEMAELSRCVAPSGPETDDWRRFLDFTDEMLVAPGDVLIQQFAHDRDVFALTAGRLEIRVARNEGEEEMVIATMSPFAVFGEQSFLDGGARTATVVASQPSMVHRLTADAFERMTKQAPDLSCALLYDIARSLSLRDRVLRADFHDPDSL